VFAKQKTGKTLCILILGKSFEKRMRRGEGGGGEGGRGRQKRRGTLKTCPGAWEKCSLIVCVQTENKRGQVG
jgi:hypothetical protein